MIETFILFGKEISVYQILSLIGILTALWFVMRTSVARQMDELAMLNLMLIGMVGALFGSHFLYAATQAEKVRYFLTHLGDISSFGDFVNRLIPIFGGAVFYGGLIGGLIAGGIYLRVKRLGGEYADLAACAIPLFHLFGRIGCFLGGCCYGIESDFGVVYRHAVPESVNGVIRFPVQLLEAVCNLCLFLTLMILFRRKKQRGLLLPLYLILYSVIRFSDEFLRGDGIRGFWGPLSTSQWISILLFASAGICYLFLTRRLASSSANRDL